MQWTDEGIVIGVKRHGEASAILELMTREHGRHLGLVRGGFGSRLKPVLQLGNSVNAAWRARLDEHLGNYTIEGLHLRAASYFSTPHAIYGVTHLAALMRLLPERDPHAGLYEALDDILGHLDDAGVAAPMVVRFELQLLSELGFGLDLDRCAATGASGDLIYVSPKSGVRFRCPATVAIRCCGFRYSYRTQGLPAGNDVADGFALTGYFLTRHALEPRGHARRWRRISSPR